MSNLIQIFCRVEPPPTLKQLMEFLSEEGFDIKFEEGEEDEEEPDQEDPSWTEARLIYDDEQEALVLECWRSEESDEFDELRDELMAMVEDMEGGSTRKIIQNLKKAQFVAQILPCEVDDEGESIINALTGFFASEFGGMVYVEEDGFYEGDELLLEAE